MGAATAFHGPLIVHGMVRSGTSLTRDLTNALDGVYLLFESPAFTALSGGRVDPAAARRLEAHLRPTAPEGGVWGTKTVRREEVALIAGLFPRARFVFVVRDPRAVAASYRRFFGGAPLVAARDWCADVAVIEDAGAQVGERAVTLRYEDVVADPAGALERLAVLAGRRVGDPDVARRVHGSGLRRWEAELSARDVSLVEGLCFEEMRRWGYAPRRAVAPGVPGPLARLTSLGRHAVGRTLRRRRPLSRLATRETVARYLAILGGRAGR